MAEERIFGEKSKQTNQTNQKKPKKKTVGLALRFATVYRHMVVEAEFHAWGIICAG